MKIKELRLLSIKIIKEGNIVFEGTTEDIPSNLKDMEYKSISFEGINVVIEI